MAVFATPAAALQGALDKRHGQLVESESDEEMLDADGKAPTQSFAGDPVEMQSRATPGASGSASLPAAREWPAGQSPPAPTSSSSSAPPAARLANGDFAAGTAAPWPEVIGAAEQAHDGGKQEQPPAPDDDMRHIQQAKMVSWMSLVVSLLVGVVGLSTGLRDGALAILGLGGETLLDAVSSAMVLWRFKTAKPRHFQDAEEAARRKARRDELRERRSSLGIGWAFVCFAIFLLLLAAQHVVVAGTEKPEDVALEEEGANIAAILSWPCIVLFGAMAWFKHHLAAQLQSEVLKQDAVCSAFGAVLALITGVAGVLEEIFTRSGSDSLAFGLVDPVASSCIAILILREGVHTIRNNLADAEEAAGLNSV